MINVRHRRVAAAAAAAIAAVASPLPDDGVGGKLLLELHLLGLRLGLRLGLFLLRAIDLDAAVIGTGTGVSTAAIVVGVVLTGFAVAVVLAAGGGGLLPGVGISAPLPMPLPQQSSAIPVGTPASLSLVLSYAQRAPRTGDHPLAMDMDVVLESWPEEIGPPPSRETLAALEAAGAAHVGPPTLALLQGMLAADITQEQLVHLLSMCEHAASREILDAIIAQHPALAARVARAAVQHLTREQASEVERKLVALDTAAKAGASAQPASAGTAAGQAPATEVAALQAAAASMQVPATLQQGFSQLPGQVAVPEAHHLKVQAQAQAALADAAGSAPATGVPAQAVEHAVVNASGAVAPKAAAGEPAYMETPPWGADKATFKAWAGRVAQDVVARRSGDCAAAKVCARTGAPIEDEAAAGSVLALHLWIDDPPHHQLVSAAVTKWSPLFCTR